MTPTKPVLFNDVLANHILEYSQQLNLDRADPNLLKIDTLCNVYLAETKMSKANANRSADRLAHLPELYRKLAHVLLTHKMERVIVYLRAREDRPQEEVGELEALDSVGRQHANLTTSATAFESGFRRDMVES